MSSTHQSAVTGRRIGSEVRRLIREYGLELTVSECRRLLGPVMGDLLTDNHYEANLCQVRTEEIHTMGKVSLEDAVAIDNGSHVCEAYLRENGPGITYEMAADALRQKGLTISRDAYTRQYRKLTESGAWETLVKCGKRPVAIIQREHGNKSAALDGNTPPPPSLVGGLGELGDSERLLGFAKFALHVEGVGGIARARAYLDLLEQLGKIS